MDHLSTVDQLAVKLAGKLVALTAEERVDYLGHLIDRPLTSIRGEAELNDALAKLDRLLDQPTLSRGDQLYLDALADLVEVYEANQIAFPSVSGATVLRHLMEANGLQRKDLIPYFGSKSIVSEVLNGKRALALSHIIALSEHFGVPVDVFVDRPRARSQAIVEPGEDRA